jgi:Uncharacterized flagellar protein FlaG
MEVSALSSQNTKQFSVPAVEGVTAPKTDVMHKEKFELSISEQVVKSSIEKANKALDGMDRRFEYSIHEKTGEVMVKVINKQTDEVVREIPNEKLLDLMDKLQELAGLNIDEKR